MRQTDIHTLIPTQTKYRNPRCAYVRLIIVLAHVCMHVALCKVFAHTVIGERERVNLVVQLAHFSIYTCTCMCIYYMCMYVSDDAFWPHI